MKKICILSCAILLIASWLLAVKEIEESFGVRILPEAESKPEVARAVEAYYRPGITDKILMVGVFETPGEFQKVYDFYGAQMDAGKWSWRRKPRVLLQQIETLKFMRSQLLAQQKQKSLPDVFKPFFGDPGLAENEFNQKLDELLKKNKDTKIEVVEGTCTIAGEPTRSQVRITAERPYIDLEKMTVVDKTRVILVKVSQGV